MATTTIGNITDEATSLNGAEYFVIDQGGETKKVKFSSMDLSSGKAAFKGAATTTTDPGTPSSEVFYLATEPGTYTNFKDSNDNAIVVSENEIATLNYKNSAWTKISQTVTSASHIHIKYSDDGGTTFTSNDGEDVGSWIGIYTDFNETDSTNVEDYNWKKLTGADGSDGTDGQTSYVHIKYSDDGGSTFTDNGGEDVGNYIGTYTDFTEADSTFVSDYTWAKIQGPKGDQGDQGPQGIQGEQGEQGPPGPDTTFIADSLNDL